MFLFIFTTKRREWVCSSNCQYIYSTRCKIREWVFWSLALWKILGPLEDNKKIKNHCINFSPNPKQLTVLNRSESYSRDPCRHKLTCNIAYLVNTPFALLSYCKKHSIETLRMWVCHFLSQRARNVSKRVKKVQNDCTKWRKAALPNACSLLSTSCMCS